MNESHVILISPQVALHPEWTIVACVFLTLLSCVGIVNFSPKSDTLSLWIPETSVSKKILRQRTLNNEISGDSRECELVK